MVCALCALSRLVCSSISRVHVSGSEDKRAENAWELICALHPSCAKTFGSHKQVLARVPVHRAPVVSGHAGAGGAAGSDDDDDHDAHAREIAFLSERKSDVTLNPCNVMRPGRSKRQLFLVLTRPVRRQTASASSRSTAC